MTSPKKNVQKMNCEVFCYILYIQILYWNVSILVAFIYRWTAKEQLIIKEGPFSYKKIEVNKVENILSVGKAPLQRRVSWLDRTHP